MEGGKINMDFKLLKEKGGKNEVQLNIRLIKKKRMKAVFLSKDGNAAFVLLVELVK